MKATPVLLLVGGLLLVACLGVGVAVLLIVRLGGASVPAIPTRVSVEPGFDGALDGAWRQLRGGFTGVEAAADPALKEHWPPGSVVDLVLEPDGAYRFTLVEASGNGINATALMVREAGRWRREGDVLELAPASGLHVTRSSGERREHPFVVTARRRYRLQTRVSEGDGPVGAAPATTEGLRLSGPCVPSGGAECSWDLDREG
jgi:hypothetical protein